MTDKEALEAFSRGKKLSQAVVERLWSKGYIEVGDATNMESITRRELIPISITERGKRLMDGD